MGVQFVLGPAGSGKTDYIIRTLIAESMEHDDMNYLYIVPEQFSMEAQRDIVVRHPRHGSMNIDAIGLNRLAYRVFDELSINPGQVLEDFGKSMLVKKILMDNQSDLLMYGSYMDKMGFVDEMKSMMSELFQYAVDRDGIDIAMDQLDSDSSTYRKLHDIRLIYEKFEEHNSNDSYVVAEQLSELLAENVEKSEFMAKSYLYFDGFTGFTPVQMKLVSKLISHSAGVVFAFDIDADQIGPGKPKEYELFRLTKETVSAISKAAADAHVDILDNVVMCKNGEVPYRFRGNASLAAFERNIFRYPHQRIKGNEDSIKLVRTDRARDEALYVASQIRNLVECQGYRYKDIAVVAGDLHDVAGYYRQAMGEYDIPVFIDENTAMRGDPCSYTIHGFLAAMSDNFSFDSVFRLLKTGMTDVDQMDVERMENYALKRNLRGYKSWLKEITDKDDSDYVRELDSIRLQIMSIFSGDCIAVYKPSSPGSKDTVKNYTMELYNFLDELDVCGKLEKHKRRLYDDGRFDEGDAYGQIFDKMVALFNKVVTILGDEKMTVKEYAGVLDAGISDMEIGIVPPTIDRVVVGDMTRSRLNHVKVLFFTGVNEGIIPKPAKKGKILSNSDRQNLEGCGVTLAPSDKTNAYIEQFYIYTCLTKPSDRLYIVYRKMGEDLNAVNPSYLVDRIRNIFPDLEVSDFDLGEQVPETVNGVLRYLVSRYDTVGDDVTLQAVRSLITDRYDGGMDDQDGKTDYQIWLAAIQNGHDYVNSTKQLTPETVRLLYGTELVESVSKLEKYSECQFKYFLQYGLGLMDRESYQLNAANVGIILHGSMEKMFEYMKAERNNDWAGITEREISEKVVEFVNISADTEAAEFFEDSSRSAYVKRFLEDIAVRTARTLRTFILCGDMHPENFERHFNTSRSADGIEDYVFELANGMTMSLKGVIDRLDEYVSDKNVYFKIIDYKSSDQKMDQDRVLAGLQMQLVTYGAIAYELEKRRMDRLRRSREDVHVGGLLYYTFDDPIVDMTDFEGDIRYDADRRELVTDDVRTFGGVQVDAIESRLLDASRYAGIYNGSSQAVQIMDSSKDTLVGKQAMDEILIKELMEANRRNIERLGNSIACGDIEINPVKQGNKSACTYCSYRPVCMFDSKYGGNTYSRMYEGEQECYNNRKNAIDEIRTEIAANDKKIKAAEKKRDSAKKKFDAAEEKVLSRGDKATAKMKENLDAAETALADAERELSGVLSDAENLRHRAAELGIDDMDRRKGGCTDGE